MKVIFLCGYFEKENENEIIKNSKTAIDYAANIFQDKLIEGLENNNYDFDIISAPFIGTYPKAYKKIFFKGFKEKQSKCKYVKFNNIWGVRNFSRTNSLKVSLKNFVELKDNEKLIIVYSAHTPLLSAAVYAKKKDPNIKICLIVPDLPQYMNLNVKKSALYKIGKKFDIRKFNKLNEVVDSYLLLTDAMKEKIDIHGMPCIVAEGIVSKNQIEMMSDITNLPQKENGCKYIVYTGGMCERYGVKELVDSFILIKDDSLRLLLCGVGELSGYIEKLSEKDKRIIYKGQVTPEESLAWVKAGDILVNPRRGEEEYTKYSFPSKNIEYLLSGNPVVAYMLPSMNNIYKNFIVEIKDSIFKTLNEVIKRNRLDTESFSIENKSHLNYTNYCKSNLLNICLVRRIVECVYCK